MSPILTVVLPLTLSLVLGKVVIAMYKSRGWIDDPKELNHPKVVHTSPVPRGGGLVVGIAILIAILFLIPFSLKIAGIIAGALLLIIIGVWDDIADPHPLLRLGFQLAASLLVVFSGVTISYVTNPLGGILSFEAVPMIGMVIASLWIVWCMNIVNFSTGLDGQMPGYVAIAALTIALLSTRFFPDPEQFTVFHLSLVVMGAYLGFLFWNMYPQKMMAGFGASTLAGFFLAILSILSGAKLATAILVLAIPMSDAGYVIFRRILQKKSPFWGDRTHLHHALLDTGVSKRMVAFIYWLTALLLGFLALNLSSGQKTFAILLILAVVCMIGTWLRMGFTSFVKSGRGNG
jgi:UDP-GlcNAc:undecaprenyl-phosphate/decaprenyl-phosphate GlcNAc-1-phosphate transferase